MAKRYEKVRTIGRGGFSTVYLVRDTHDGGEKCVLKEMNVVQMSAVKSRHLKHAISLNLIIYVVGCLIEKLS